MIAIGAVFLGLFFQNNDYNSPLNIFICLNVKVLYNDCTYCYCFNNQANASLRLCV